MSNLLPAVLLTLSLVCGACVDRSALDALRCQETGAPCEAGLVCVQGYCVPSCPSTPCDAGSTCVEGRCLCGGDEICDAAEVCCGGACVDTRASLVHCGACGNTCGVGETCLEGSCVCGRSGVRCAEGQLCCNGERCEDPDACSCGGRAACGSTERCCDDGAGGVTCVDVATNSESCGACDVVCSAEERCAEGVCTCQAERPNRCCLSSTTEPDDCDVTTCTDLLSDPDNCGACGVTCEPGAICCQGACLEATTCP